MIRLVGLLALIAVLVVGITGLRVWQVARQDDRGKADAIVVLGASQYDGRPTAVFEARLDHAKTLYDQGVAPRVVTVGGNQPGDRFTEGEAGARYLRSHGVGTAVALGEGNNTLQSLQALQAEFRKQGWRSAVLVTDPWHSLRSRQIAQDLGMTASTSPARSGPVVQTRSTEGWYVLRETVAYLSYRAFGSSGEPGPAAV